MALYYFSILSVVPLLIAYAVLGGLYRLVEAMSRGVRGRWLILTLTGALVLVLPVSQELWIAWKFALVCEEAGTHIYKRVHVEGFLHDAGGGGLELVRSGGYRFIESRSRDGYTRISLGNDTLRKQVLAKFDQEKPGIDPAKVGVIRVRLQGNEEAILYPRTGDIWRVVRIEQPTARYHYKMTASHSPVAHRITKHEAIVLDSDKGELLGKYTLFSRDAPWFYVSIGKGDFSCDAPKRWPGTRGYFTIYRDILVPLDAEK